MIRYAMIALTALVLAGCAGQDDSGATQPNKIWPHHVTLPDGRSVLCVYEGQGYGAGTSCDWANAK